MSSAATPIACPWSGAITSNLRLLRTTLETIKILSMNQQDLLLLSPCLSHVAYPLSYRVRCIPLTTVLLWPCNFSDFSPGLVPKLASESVD